jgi:hypothetical protein
MITAPAINQGLQRKARIINKRPKIERKRTFEFIMKQKGGMYL